jgi:hypothetical protein
MDASSLFASMMIGTIGFGFFLYGKKQQRWPQLVTGLVLMIFPYFVGGVALMLAISGAVLGALMLAVRAGW